MEQGLRCQEDTAGHGGAGEAGTARAEDITAERVHQALLAGLEEGRELRQMETREPASPQQVAKQELSRD